MGFFQGFLLLLLFCFPIGSLFPWCKWLLESCCWLFQLFKYFYLSFGLSYLFLKLQFLSAGDICWCVSFQQMSLLSLIQPSLASPSWLFPLWMTLMMMLILFLMIYQFLDLAEDLEVHFLLSSFSLTQL